MDDLVRLRDDLNQTKREHSEESFRKDILDLFRDYRHPWDVYTELVQNSVDAINMSAEDSGNLNLVIDSERRELIVQDNGIGIPHDEVMNVLIPSYSLDKDFKKTYGYKGVGLSFVLHLTEFFSIETVRDGYKTVVEVSKCIDWVALNHKRVIKKEKVECTDSSGTKIKLRLPPTYSKYSGNKLRMLSSFDDFFDWSSDEKIVEYVLRTKTAVGNVKAYLGEDLTKDIKISLIVDGNKRDVPYSYLTPYDTSYSQRNRYRLKMSVDKNRSYEDIYSDGGVSDSKKKFHCLRHDFLGLEVGSRPMTKFDLSVLVCGETGISELEKEFNLTKENSNDNSKSFGARAGIYLSINGMPTDICLYRWDNGFDRRFLCFVDVDMDVNGELDKGRKGISIHTKRLIRDEVERRLKEKIVLSKPSRTLRKVATMLKQKRTKGYAGTDVGNHLNKWDAQATLIKGMSFDKPPLDENGVIALFFECIGRGLIDGYKIRYISQDATYDLAFSYLLEETRVGLNEYLSVSDEFLERHGFEANSDGVFLISGIRGLDYHTGEFKISAENILNNDDQTLEQLDLLISWDFSESALEAKGASIYEISPEDRKFEGVTHEIQDENGTSQVIVLKSLLDNLGKIIDL